MSRLLFPLLAFVIVASFAVSPSLHAECFWVDHLDTDPTYVCVPDLYYVTITPSDTSAAPDWCSYTQGDHVFLKFDHNIPNAPIESYYFIPAYDTTTAAPTGFDSSRFWVYNNSVSGCGFSIF